MSPDNLHLVIRADASARIGVGHVMRSLTLAHALVDLGWSVSLLSHELPAALRARAARYGVRVIKLAAVPYGKEDSGELAALRPSFAVVDGYSFRDEFFRALSCAGVRHLIVDDNRETPLDSATAVLNQNLHATESQYAGLSAGVTLLLGPRFALIRPEVVARRRTRRVEARPHSVLVSVGGSDVLNLTSGLVSAIGSLENVAVLTAKGGSRLALPEIADLLADSAVAVIGAGTTMWEACYLGIPCVALVVADNQVQGARSAAALGAVRQMDCRHGKPYSAVASQVRELLDSPDTRRLMEMAGRKLIDGHGAQRVARVITRLARDRGMT